MPISMLNGTKGPRHLGADRGLHEGRAVVRRLRRLGLVAGGDARRGDAAPLVDSDGPHAGHLAQRVERAGAGQQQARIERERHREAAGGAGQAHGPLVLDGSHGADGFHLSRFSRRWPITGSMHSLPNALR
jgi:hypothetical protein